MPATPTELLLTWESMVITLSDEAAQMRDLGMRDTAALIRSRRDTLKACAESLRDALGLPPIDPILAALKKARREESKLLRPLRERSSATCPPAAIASPVGVLAPATMTSATTEPAALPSTAGGQSTTHPQGSPPPSSQSAPTPHICHQSCPGTSSPAPGTPQASAQPASAQSCPGSSDSLPAPHTPGSKTDASPEPSKGPWKHKQTLEHHHTAISSAIA